MLGILRRSRRRKRRNNGRISKKNIISNVVTLPHENVRLQHQLKLNELKLKVRKIERNTIKHFNKNISNSVKVNFRQLVEALPQVIQSGQICKDRKQRRREIFKRTRGKGLKVKKTNWNLYSYVRCN